MLEGVADDLATRLTRGVAHVFYLAVEIGGNW